MYTWVESRTHESEQWTLSSTHERRRTRALPKYISALQLISDHMAISRTRLGWMHIFWICNHFWDTSPLTKSRFLIRPFHINKHIFKRSRAGGSETLIDLGRYAPFSTHRHPHPAKPSQDGRATMHVNCCFSIFSVKSYPWGSEDPR